MKYILAFAFALINSLMFLAIVGFLLLGSHGKLNLQNSYNLFLFLIALCFIITPTLHFIKYKVLAFNIPGIIFYLLSILSVSYLMIFFVQKKLFSNFLFVFFLQIFLLAINIYYFSISCFTLCKKLPSKSPS